MAPAGPAAEFDKMKLTLEALAQAVIDQMQRLELASVRGDQAELKRIVALDKDIDDLELTIDRLCLSFMEMRAPIGPDFRFVVGAADIARSMERIGDCIEYVARYVAENPKMAQEFPRGWTIITDMMDKCLSILQMIQRAWTRSDAKAARSIPAHDDEVDALQKKMYAQINTDVRSGEVDVGVGMIAMLIVNKLESLADVACHIAESIVYVILAKQIRHSKAEERLNR